MRTLNGKAFLDKPMQINYAKSKSDAVALADGTFVPRKVGQDVKVAKPQEAGDGKEAGKTKARAGSDATLFVEGLPEEMNDAAMITLFRQYPGFVEVRLIPARRVAFVDYQSDMQADVAMSGLNGFLVTPTQSLKISKAAK
eukprot:CAMPEP_0113858402 /NCGR_PEP_ID=MMETSP0372-20130328/11214_1 /TAXON_ID=340204 /ORGANISM="Lankesteria abbotti" /LENGTH=140 /DNA_ID=CAMNT_0000835395 /DNA_START=57 /DNA_END=479 /DNA_ORIENTATION=- /assembly_acc=CAM_ASM_000359